MEHLFLSLIQDDAHGEGKEELYVSERLLTKVSKYLEKEPGLIRCNEISEDGWFNKKESYIQKRLKHKRNEGKYHLGISNLHRGYNGHRVTRYLLFWMYERDVYYINNNMGLEPSGEVVPVDTLPNLYRIINIDDIKKKG